MPIADQQYTALQQLDGVIADTVSHISDFTKHQGDFTRDRKLNASTTIKVTLNMEGQSLNTEIIHAFPDMDDRMTTSAYEQQKAKLSPELFMHLFREYNQTPYRHNLYNGKYELFATDGSDFNMPYQSKSKYAMKTPTGRPKKNGEPVKPFSQLHGNLLFNITDRTYQDVVIQPKSACDERGAAIEMFERLNPVHPYIILMDRGYDGFNMIEHCNRLNGDGYYVIRTKAGAGGIKEIAELPDKECDVMMDFKVTTSGQYYIQNKDTERIHLVNSPKKHHKKYYSPNTKNQRWDFKQFEHIKCRVVKFQINDPESGKQVWEVLITNLNRFEFPISKLKEIYHRRWGEETAFMELKYAIGAIQFHSKKDDFIIMELLANMVMYNAVSRSVSAVKLKKVGRKWNHAIDFKMAVAITRRFFRIDNHAPPDDMTKELVSYTHPIRPNRPDERKSVRIKSPVWFVYRVAA